MGNTYNLVPILKNLIIFKYSSLWQIKKFFIFINFNYIYSINFIKKYINLPRFKKINIYE